MERIIPKFPGCVIRCFAPFKYATLYPLSLMNDDISGLMGREKKLKGY